MASSEVVEPVPHTPPSACASTIIAKQDEDEEEELKVQKTVARFLTGLNDDELVAWYEGEDCTELSIARRNGYKFSLAKEVEQLVTKTTKSVVPNTRYTRIQFTDYTSELMESVAMKSSGGSRGVVVELIWKEGDSFSYGLDMIIAVRVDDNACIIYSIDGMDDFRPEHQRLKKKPHSKKRMHAEQTPVPNAKQAESNKTQEVFSSSTIPGKPAKKKTLLKSSLIDK